MRSCILFCVAAFLALSWSPSSVFIVSSVLAPSSPSSHHPASLYRSLISFAISFVQWLLLLPVASLAVLLDVLVTVGKFWLKLRDLSKTLKKADKRTADAVGI
ncbi:uncharacterized protein LOC107493456 [Arachis duranensis]|uniref:Uncharacterized protein LOC107493456 n=1 Tax=Arachis duranensis TaxID=130453 RepID=A0A9C6TXT3_ARADU|nr:uncharacterized protein LOC107493456 [Arachis duranensis]